MSAIYDDSFYRVIFTKLKLPAYDVYFIDNFRRGLAMWLSSPDPTYTEEQATLMLNNTKGAAKYFLSKCRVDIHSDRLKAFLDTFILKVQTKNAEKLRNRIPFADLGRLHRNIDAANLSLAGYFEQNIVDDYIRDMIKIANHVLQAAPERTVDDFKTDHLSELINEETGDLWTSKEIDELLRNARRVGEMKDMNINLNYFTLAGGYVLDNFIEPRSLLSSILPPGDTNIPMHVICYALDVNVIVHTTAGDIEIISNQDTPLIHMNQINNRFELSKK